MQVTAQDVIDWVAKFKKLYNNHPHSSLGYVCPNDEHAGLGNAIRQIRKENLMAARQKIWRFVQTSEQLIGITRR